MINEIFPFGLPAPSAFYMLLYTLTLLAHFAFMTYVLGGTAYIALLKIWRFLGFISRERGRAEEILIDWMPAMLSGAITAAIAPLLFLQILYKHSFYTANLLLFHRWMAILPVLIVAFYALYLLRTVSFQTWRPWLRVAVALIAFLGMVFTGYSWVENHMLSLRGQSYWSQFYAARHMLYFEPVMLPRFLIWFGLSWAGTATILAWQLWYQNPAAKKESYLQTAGLGRVALGGLIITLLSAAFCLHYRPELARLLYSLPFSLPYCAAGVIGLALHALSWLKMAREGALSLKPLSLASLGLAAFMYALIVVREGARMQQMGEPVMRELFTRHAEALRVGGFGVFLFFLAVNLVLVGVCFVLVRRGSRA